MSPKPGNIVPNWRRFFDLMPDVGVAAVDLIGKNGFVTTLVALYVWNKLWRGSEAKLTDAEASSVRSRSPLTGRPSRDTRTSPRLLRDLFHAHIFAQPPARTSNTGRASQVPISRGLWARSQTSGRGRGSVKTVRVRVLVIVRVESKSNAGRRGNPRQRWPSPSCSSASCWRTWSPLPSTNSNHSPLRTDTRYSGCPRSTQRWDGSSAVWMQTRMRSEPTSTEITSICTPSCEWTSGVTVKVGTLVTR
jgi:hypothetical protein